MSVQDASDGARATRARARFAAALAGGLLAVVALIGVTTADADAGSAPGVWETYDTAEAPTNPYVGAANRGAKDAGDTTQSYDCFDVPTVPPSRNCKIYETRAGVDGSLDGPSNAVPPVVESGPPAACVAVEGRAASCYRGGESGDGRTYYKGSGPPDYHWEHQGSSVQSTNHRVVKVVYNSMRIRYRGNGGIYMKTRDGRVDRDGNVHYWGSYDMLVSESFSARYRISYCHNVDHPNYVRCAYDWVR